MCYILSGARVRRSYSGRCDKAVVTSQRLYVQKWWTGGGIRFTNKQEKKIAPCLSLHARRFKFCLTAGKKGSHTNMPP